MSRPSPASRASIVNSTGRLAGIPDALRPGPLARTLLASWAGSTLILKGLERVEAWMDSGQGGILTHWGVNDVQVRSSREAQRGWSQDPNWSWYAGEGAIFRNLYTCAWGSTSA